MNNWELLAKVKRIVIATDGDEPGVRLAAELVRRLGRVRCYFVTYPKDAAVDGGEGRKRPCKDLNEVLLAFGAAEVVRIIASATPYPVAGVYRLSAFPQEPDLMPVSTGWETWTISESLRAGLHGCVRRGRCRESLGRSARRQLGASARMDDRHRLV